MWKCEFKNIPSTHPEAKLGDRLQCRGANMFILRTHTVDSPGIKKPKHKAKNDKKFWWGLMISLFSLSLAGLSFMYNIIGTPGETSLFLPPDGYGVMRFNIYPYFRPSDHLIIPLRFINTSGREVHIRDIYLELNEINVSDQVRNETGNKFVFWIAGELQDLTPDSMRRPYKIINSIHVPAKSTSYNLLLFHHQDWWDTKHPNYNLTFKPGKIYEVWINYKIYSMKFISGYCCLKQPRDRLFTMRANESLNNLSQEKNTWDFWYMTPRKESSGEIEVINTMTPFPIGK